MDLEDLIAKKDKFLDEIATFETVAIVSHNKDDMDNLVSKKLMEYILEGLGTKNIYLTMDPNAHWDVKELLEQTDWKLYDKDHPLPKKPDAVIMVDAHYHRNVSMPKYEEAGDILSIEPGTVPLYCFDHHQEEKANDEIYSVKIIEPGFYACAAMILKLFEDSFRPDGCDEPKLDVDLSTALYQALFIDTAHFKKKDEFIQASYRLATRNNNFKLNEKLRIKPMTKDEAVEWSRVYDTRNWIEDNGVATLCYIGESKKDIIPSAADVILESIKGTNDLSLVAGAFSIQDAKTEKYDNMIRGSIRARSDKQVVTAEKLANLISHAYCSEDRCGGKTMQAYIEIDTGILRYCLDTPMFAGLLKKDLDALISQKVQGAQKREDLTEITYGTATTEIGDLLQKDLEQKSTKGTDISSTIKWAKQRYNGRIVTLGVNLYNDMDNSIAPLAEYELLDLLKLNRNIVEYWKSDKFKGATSNLIYGMIAQNIQNAVIAPSLIVLHCYKADNGNDNVEFDGIFKEQNYQQHTLTQNIDEVPYSVNFYRFPIMRVNDREHLWPLQLCVHEEIKTRFDKVLGKD